MQFQCWNPNMAIKIWFCQSKKVCHFLSPGWTVSLLTVTMKTNNEPLQWANALNILTPPVENWLQAFHSGENKHQDSLGSRREAFLSQNISTCLCSFTFNPAFHQNSKVFSYNLALPLIYCWPNWPLTIEPIENTDKKSQNCLCQRVCV